MIYFIRDHLLAIGAAIAVAAVIACATVYVQIAHPTSAEGAPIDKLVVTVSSSAADWNADSSTPPIVRVKGKGDDGELDYYHAFAIGADEVIELAPGEYALTFVTPVNADGTFYETPAEARFDTAASDGGAVAVTAAYHAVPADKVTDEQVSGIIAAVTDAASFGDGTLSGTTGEKLVSTVKLYLAGASASRHGDVSAKGTLDWDTDDDVRYADDDEDDEDDKDSPTTDSDDKATNGDDSTEGDAGDGTGEDGDAPRTVRARSAADGSDGRGQALSYVRKTDNWVEPAYEEKPHMSAVWVDDGDGCGHYEMQQDGSRKMIKTPGHYQ